MRRSVAGDRTDCDDNKGSCSFWLYWLLANQMSYHLLIERIHSLG